MKQQLLNLFATPRDMTWEDILLNIVLAAVLGFFIFLSYALSHRGTIYSRKFNASLVILAVLTGTVMTVIGNNIALSLGMVGAAYLLQPLHHSAEGRLWKAAGTDAREGLLCRHNEC